MERAHPEEVPPEEVKVPPPARIDEETPPSGTTGLKVKKRGKEALDNFLPKKGKGRGIASVVAPAEEQRGCAGGKATNRLPTIMHK